MKKIILLILVLLMSSLGFAQDFTEDFESITNPPDASGVWTFGSLPGSWLVRDNRNNTGINWEVNPQALYPAHSGTKAAFVNRESLQGVYAEEWLITPQITVQANRQLRFFTRQTQTGSPNPSTLYQVRVSNSPNQGDLNAYTTLIEYNETTLSTLTQTQLDYEEKILNLAFSGARYFAFVKVYTQPGAAPTGDRWLIDDVRVVPRCNEPSSLGTANLSATGGTLNWVAVAGSYSIEYGVSGFTPGTGTVVDGIPESGALDSYVIPVGTLTPDTCYQFYVTAHCGTAPNDSSSLQTGPFNFCTSPLGATCAGPIVVPQPLGYFDASNTLEYGNNINPTGTGTGCGASGNFLAGNDVVYQYTNPNTVNQIINIRMNPGTATSTGLFVYSSCATIGTSCLAGVGNANATIREIPQLTLTPGQTIYIVLSSAAATPSYPYTLTIQEVACTAPTNGTTVANTIGMTDAQLTWQNPTGSSWQVSVQLAASVGIPTSWISTQNNLTQSAAAAFGAPLTAATAYAFWVRTDCGNGLFSTWSGPYFFNTKICEVAQQCNYTFVLNDSASDGWDGATMQVKQNGIVVATLGSTFTNGGGPINVTVPMCNNLPFELFWNNAGDFPGEVRVAIRNSFNQTIFAITTASAALANTVVYSGTVDCVNPLCLRPTGVAVPNASITTNGATINWTTSGVPTTGWQLYIVPQTSPNPTNASTPTHTVAAPPATYAVTGLAADTCYKVFVRSVCSVNSPSEWTLTAVNFCTLPTCPKPTGIQVPTATISMTGATINWNSVGAATGYQVAIVPTGTVLPLQESVWLPIQTATTYTAPAGSLTSGTIYDVYVRSICLGGTDIGQPSAVVTFSTLICLPADKCIYSFVTSDSFGDGWNGATMQVRQNGIVVATITGPTNNDDLNPITFNVGLCNGVPFDLFWSLPGGFPAEVRVRIRNNFNQELYAMTVASPGLAGTVLYTSGEPIDCAAPLCLSPTAVVVTPDIFDINISWTASTFNTAYDVYIVESTLPAPTSATTPTYSNVTGTSLNTLTALPLQHLNPSTNYTVYVRAICDANSPSDWSPGTPVRTLPTCPQPINLIVNFSDANSAELQWTSVGPATQWEVFVVPANSPVPAPGTGVIVAGAAGGTIVYNTLTGTPSVPGAPLDAGFYDYYVRALCEPNDPSDISGPTSFFIFNTTSACPAVEIPIPTTGPGVIDLCPGENCVALTADFVDFKDTSTYLVDAVPFAPPFPFTGGTQLNIATDDIWGPPVTLPFDFCFFGVNSQQVQVGSNGVVTFTPQAFPGTCPWAFTQTIPNNTSTIPRNAIYGVYQDTNPSVSTAPLVHSINYQILGTAPCRSFVVNYYQLAQFSCGTEVGLQTSQIVLYETSNIVEVYVQDRTVCSDWNSGSGLIGIQNTAGTQAHFPPGRNTGPWEAHNEGWRFTPNGSSNVQFTWLQGTTPVGNGATDITVCVSETTLMTARATYTGCGGDQVVKEATVLLNINEVDIAPIADVSSCECYVLPALPAGQHYYTATGGPTGTGVEITAGTQICDPTTTVYVYAASNTVPPCSDEEFFQVNVNQVQAPEFPDVTVCTSYILPDLPEPFFYFSEPDGGGTNYPNGTEISTPGIIHIIGVNGDCISQTEFEITIGDIVAVTPSNVTDCTGYILPELPVNQTYHSAPGGSSTDIILPGTEINTPGLTTIYIYAAQGTCVDESSFTITIDDEIVPTFVQVEPICLNGTAADLPLQSTNSPTPIVGTWSPSATIDTSVEGTFTYTFTPNGDVACAVPTTMDITISPLITPTFNPIQAVCLNAAAPVLPTQSADTPPITGSWAGTIDTTVEGTYPVTFTPDAGQACAQPTTINVVVNAQITPVFTQIANICQNAAAPVLPAISNAPGSVPGIWSPAAIDTSVAGMTTYTFTPDATLTPCAVAVTMDITIDPEIKPVPASIADVCVGGSVTLPATVGGLTGTWSPANVDTTVPSSIGYVFTPDAGQGCTVSSDPITINVIAPQLPVFNGLPSVVCIGDAVPALPGISDNGTPITGTWNPSAIDNTLSQTYEFTPDAGQCASVLQVNISVLPTVTPTFTQIAPICAGDALVLPTQSNNVPAITGTWGTVNNMETTIYTFTPTAGQCATTTTMTVVVNPVVSPAPAAMGPFCKGSVATALPSTVDGVTGTWNPATINTNDVGIVNYTFTPDASVVCAVPASIPVEVTEQPDFTLMQGCVNNNYVLSIDQSNLGSGGANYQWSNSQGIIAGANEASLTVTAPGIYSLKVSIGDCSLTVPINVLSASCDIQRGISPGDGGKNDFFDLSGQGVSKLEIFNRYGTKVYSQLNYQSEWFGQSDKGDELPDGTYFYVIEYAQQPSKTGWIYINRVK